MRCQWKMRQVFIRTIPLVVPTLLAPPKPQSSRLLMAVGTHPRGVTIPSSSLLSSSTATGSLKEAKVDTRRTLGTMGIPAAVGMDTLNNNRLHRLATVDTLKDSSIRKVNR